MQPDELVEYIASQPRGRVDFRHLAKQLRAKGKKRLALQRAVGQLAERGLLVEFRAGHYAVPNSDSEFTSGRLRRHRDGFGFVIPDKPLPGGADVFIPPPALGEAMNDDRVLVRITRIGEDGRADGRIEKILKRTHQFIVGMFRYAETGCFVAPHDERLRDPIAITAGHELPSGQEQAERLGDLPPPEVRSARELDGMIVTVEVTSFPIGLELARGRVVEILGQSSDFGIDVEIIIRKFHLPHRFPSQVRDEVGLLSGSLDPLALAGRRDFRDLDVVTIDGESARDFDDAVWVRRLENGNFALQVHIADVSHYVRPGSALDQEARLRGTSVYFPDRAVPMLPAELSTGICSLNPKAGRLVLSALMEIDKKGNVTAAEFCRGVIRSAERMTYADVFRILDGDEEARHRYRPLVENFERMKELALILNRRRNRRGSIDFDLPAAEIEFNETGEMVGVAAAERNIAHRIIEEFMLTANEAVARHIEDRGAGSLYRIHEKPDVRRVVDFEQVAGSFGYSLGVDVPHRRFQPERRRGGGPRRRAGTLAASTEIDITPRHYQKLIKKVEGKPEERIISYLMLRSLKQARYSDENGGHFALATACYTHFTSPIRRYPDLVVHRILKALIDAADPGAAGAPGASPVAAGPYPATELGVIGQETSFTERRAAEAERALLNWKKAKFIEARLGDEFDAVVIQVVKAGLIVELIDFFVEGLVPIETLPRGRFRYNENLRALVNPKTKQKFSIGDHVRVRAERVTFEGMRAEFACLPQKNPTKAPQKVPKKSRARQGTSR